MAGGVFEDSSSLRILKGPFMTMLNEEKRAASDFAACELFDLIAGTSPGGGL